MNIEKEIQKNIPLAQYTTFHIGGPADYFVKVSTTDEIVAAVTWANSQNIPFFMLGQGANVLVGDKGFRGLVIKNEAMKRERLASSLDEQEVLITAESGVTIAELIDQTAALGLSGLEYFAGIPSSLGGALWQNLHFLSQDRSKTVFIAGVVKNAKILMESGEVKDVDKTYFHFDYDYSILHTKHDIVLSATLALQKDEEARIKQTIADNLTWRSEKHPENAWEKSAGSVFKKIERYGAGRLIEQIGLKGRKIGGAEISEKHANFIINTGTATARDVRDLISLIQFEVKKTTGQKLEPEISFVGEF